MLNCFIWTSASLEKQETQHSCNGINWYSYDTFLFLHSWLSAFWMAGHSVLWLGVQTAFHQHSAINLDLCWFSKLFSCSRTVKRKTHSVVIMGKICSANLQPARSSDTSKQLQCKQRADLAPHCTRPTCSLWWNQSNTRRRVKSFTTMDVKVT